MWKERLTSADTRDVGLSRVLERVERLALLGAGALRFAVPDEDGADALGCLARECVLPLIADIHFDYRLALRCLDYPIAAIRINPGNIGGAERVSVVLGACADK
jgi:(E)-4-hydroxy-3-methylbut-2-enyl-diphosphate synthase